MKALLSHAVGGPETLRMDTVPDPVPGPDQVLVRVASVALNYPDALMIEDLYQFKPPRPFAVGGEVAGTVVAIGENISHLKVGDRVCSLCGHGGLAELVVLEGWRTFMIPDDMRFDVASAIIFTYGTNLHGLVDRAELKAGDTMLVLGAAGGIGIAAVELGKMLGARVVAAVSSQEKKEAALKAGADDVIIYPRGPVDKAASRELANRFKAACPAGYQVIYDPVGGDYAEPALRSIGWEGRYAVVGFTAGIAKMPLNLPLLNACSVIGVYWGAWALRNRSLFRSEIETLLGYWSAGKIRPQISQPFAFEDAPQALAQMRQRGAVGKLVVRVSE